VLQTLRHGLLAVILLTLSACATGEAKSTCQGFADRKLGVTGQEYRPCAGEILAALDGMRPPLRAMVAGKATDAERTAARTEYRRLKALIRQTGLEKDYQSLQPGTVITKWPDDAVGGFNSAAFKAMVQYMAVLAHPNADNFGQGLRAHDDARRFYAAIR
jgi:hypothetical protein